MTFFIVCDKIKKLENVGCFRQFKNIIFLKEPENMKKKKRKQYASFPIGSTVRLRKFYEGLPKNYELIVLDNQKKTVANKKHAILVRDTLTPRDFYVQTKYLDL